MINAVLTAIDRYDMLHKGDAVVVALSGGADSVSLLHCLYSIKEKYQLTLHAAHLYHGIRGGEAERDEQFCKILCEKYQIPLHIRHADIPRLAKEQKISEELCGRNERYRFFAALSEQYHAKIATAHTASDNAETLLFHLTRGTSLHGAAGIPPVRGSIIRPLILCTRDEIEAYCCSNGLAFVTDSTNLTDSCTRNKIRHRVIPALKEINPALEQAITRFCESAAAENAYIQREVTRLLEQAQADFGYSAAVLNRADKAVLNAALMRLSPARTETRHLALLRAILQHGGAVDLGDTQAICKQGIFRFAAKKETVTAEEIPLRGQTFFSHGGKTVMASIQNSDSELNNLVFRRRQPGDRFTFAKRSLTKPLRKALNEQKIPDEARDALLLLCQGGTVLWCEFLGFSKQGAALQREKGLKIEII